jgi:hypothetical protein
MGSTCDFKKGYAPENSNTISFLEDNKTYVKTGLVKPELKAVKKGKTAKKK